MTCPHFKKNRRIIRIRKPLDSEDLDLYSFSTFKSIFLFLKNQKAKTLTYVDTFYLFCAFGCCTVIFYNKPKIHAEVQFQLR